MQTRLKHIIKEIDWLHDLEKSLGFMYSSKLNKFGFGSGGWAKKDCL